MHRLVATLLLSSIVIRGAAASTPLPLVFEPNRGQADRKAAYLLRAGDWRLHLERRGLTVQRAGAGPLRVRFAGDPRDVRLEPGATLPGRVAYFDTDPRPHLAGIPTYGEVWYHHLAAGIAARVYVAAGRVEYDLVVPPGGDLDAFALAIDGADHLTVDRAGDLILDADGQSLRMAAPVVYQDDATGRRPVAGAWRVRGRRAWIALGAYDRTKPLVADPVFAFATYLGGSAHDFTDGLALGPDDAIYLAGKTASADFPRVPAGSAVTSGMFVAKLDPTASALLYAAVFPVDATVRSLAVDAFGRALVVGNAGAGFPVVNAVQNAPAGGRDAVIARLDAAGSALDFSTYLGGSGDDMVYEVALDASGGAYVAGGSAPPATTTDFPVASAAQPVRGGGDDGFAAAFAPDGTLRWSTFVGGESNDLCTDIAVSAAGDVYVSGTSSSWNFPTTPGAYRPQITSGALALSDDGGTSWAFGGPPSTAAAAVTVDPAQPSVVLAGAALATATETGDIFRSTDGGGTWSRVHAGAPNTAIVRLLVDPTTAGRRFALVDVAAAPGVPTVMRSIDGGATWTPATDGLPAAPILDLALAPSAPGTVYAVVDLAHDPRLYRTVDAGDTWTTLPTTLPAARIVADPTHAGRLVVATVDGMIHRSSDGGVTFPDGPYLCDAPLCGYVTTLAIDPTDGDRLFAGRNDGLFRSVDGGVTWARTCIPGTPRVVAVDPAAPQRVLAATIEGGVFHSSDGGDLWTVVRPLLGRSVAGFAFDPNGSRVLAAAYHAPRQSFLLRYDADGHLGFSTLTASGADLALDPAGNAILPGERVTASGTATTLTPPGLAVTQWLSRRVVDADGRVHAAGFGAAGGLVAEWRLDAPADDPRCTSLNGPSAVAVAVPSDGGTIVTGGAYDGQLAGTAGAVQPTAAGGVDAYVAKIAAGDGDSPYSCQVPTTTTTTIPFAWMLGHCDPPVGPTTTVTTTSTTTTTLEPSCHDDRSCTDRDRCTRDVRCDGVCRYVLPGGLEQVACASRDLLATASCSADEICPRLRLRVDRVGRRAMRLIRGAIGASAVPHARWLARADGQLATLAATVQAALDDGRVSSACAQRVVDAIATVRAALGA